MPHCAVHTPGRVSVNVRNNYRGGGQNHGAFSQQASLPGTMLYRRPATGTQGRRVCTPKAL